jgi:hypothetical protein
LVQILAGLPKVQPLGGKYGMRDRVKARREILGERAVFGLLDGDFRREWTEPTRRPKDWVVDSGKTFLGWRWERKEIENYMLDPEVVRRALGDKAPNGTGYQAALERARDQLPIYEAARLALSAHRPRFDPMANCFGRPRGKHGHVMPDDFGENACLLGIQQAVTEHNEGQTVALESVRVEFQRCRPECEAGGPRFAHFLTAFAGKDLVHAMAADLQALGFPSPAVFLEKVLRGLENATEDVAGWLEEWAALRQAVATV